MSSGPEVELIASRAAGEAAVDGPLEIHGEPRRHDGWAVRQQAVAAELGTASTQGTEAVNQCQAALGYGVPVGWFGDVAPRLRVALEEADWWPHPELQILSGEISDVRRFLACNAEL